MYVEELIPETITQALPILFWPGTGSVGTCFATTPDGRPGWSAYFLRHGFVVYLIDPPCRGRSAPKPEPEKTVHVDSNYAETFWTATAHNGDKWPQAHLHSQWPGTGKQGDRAFDQFMASQAPSTSDYTISEQIAQTAGSALVRQIGPVILCTHSAGASPGWLIADAEPGLVKAIVALEPLGKFRNWTGYTSTWVFSFLGSFKSSCNHVIPKRTLTHLLRSTLPEPHHLDRLIFHTEIRSQ